MRILEATVPELPADRPRYLMGVGRPEDLLEAIAPRHRPVRLRDAHPKRPQRDGLHRPRTAAAAELPNTSGTSARLEAGCPCAACRRSRGYLRHLFMAGEMLGPILLSIHNLTYYQRLLADARQAIEQDEFEPFRQTKLHGWATGTRGTRRRFAATAGSGFPVPPSTFRLFSHWHIVCTNLVVLLRRGTTSRRG